MERKGIPAELYQQLREALLNCAPFDNPRSLRALFVDERIAPWQRAIPEAGTELERAAILIDYLHAQENEWGENALVLLLRVFSENALAGTACQQRLAVLADALVQELDSATVPQSRMKAPRIPFMVEPLGAFVPRLAEYEALRARLLDRKEGTAVGITTALRGAGGYGKTTLARALCHDPEVRAAFPDGILWVTLGENPSDLTSKVLTLIRSLNPEEIAAHADAGLAAAANRLSELLVEQQLLLVVDDVWEEAHLRPFLRGGATCARLITTRNSDTLPRGARQVQVDAMCSSEAIALLGLDLPEGYEADLAALAVRLGEWPLLLQLVNKFLYDLVSATRVGVGDALHHANETLTSLGLTAFDDPTKPEARERATSATLRASLKRLKTEARYGRFMVDEQRCYHDLAIFPEDIDIPLSTLARLWGLELSVVGQLCLRLYKLSLLLAYDTKTIRLHDVVRTFLVEEQGAALPARQAIFLDSYNVAHWTWSTLPHDEHYLLRHLAYHLREAGRSSELDALRMSQLETWQANILLDDF